MLIILETHPTPFFQIYVIYCIVSLTQAVQEDTHTSPQGSTSLIDLALVSEISLLSSCCVIPPGYIRPQRYTVFIKMES